MNPPLGYSQVRIAGAMVVARTTHLDAVRAAMGDGSLYDYAVHHIAARAMAGRAAVFAVPLPDAETRIVVRHSQHGGALGALTGDLFLAPTRAPRELETSLRLIRLGVPTPELIAYATYPAFPPFYRADVATREVPDARDFDAALRDTGDDAAQHTAVLDAAAALLRTLGAAGVRHPDLNLKNLLIASRDGGGLDAWLLDVDRVWFDEPGSAAARDANMRRLARSARKRRRLFATPMDEADLRRLAELAEATFPES